MKSKNEILSAIVAANLTREERDLSPHACHSHRGVRRFPEREKVPDSQNFRPLFFHDTDKIIHSMAFTRYIDKTQVFYLFENDHITHRALHVQFVAKIGRVIGRALRLNEDLIEAIALGHDLGHPPYGHDGEKKLHQLCRDHQLGAFCHNAQSVRALMETERHGQGLNLTLQVLDGILSHNGEMLDRKYEPDYSKSWERFQNEYQHCLHEQDYSRKVRPMTLEGCVVRISDIIAYIGRDIEDAIILKVLKRKDIPAPITQVLGEKNDRIINTLVTDLIVQSYDQPYLAFSEDVFRALFDLKAFNFRAIYSNERIKKEGNKIENMFSQLFGHYLQDLERKSELSPLTKSLTDMDPAYLKNTPPKRQVIDFLAGMTDDFFNHQFKEHFVPQSYGYAL